MYDIEIRAAVLLIEIKESIILIANERLVFMIDKMNSDFIFNDNSNVCGINYTIPSPIMVVTTILIAQLYKYL